MAAENVLAHFLSLVIHADAEEPGKPPYTTDSLYALYIRHRAFYKHDKSPVLSVEGFERELFNTSSLSRGPPG